jgi:NADH-quinone oxidoreductase subunit H
MALLIIILGFVILIICSLLVEFVARKLYARFQNHIWPPWFQPFADFVKLTGIYNHSRRGR